VVFSLTTNGSRVTSSTCNAAESCWFKIFATWPFAASIAAGEGTIALPAPETVLPVPQTDCGPAPFSHISESW
jgi:hypothetical protein